MTNAIRRYILDCIADILEGLSDTELYAAKLVDSFQAIAHVNRSDKLTAAAKVLRSL